MLGTFADGTAALTRRAFGTGEAYYLATLADPDGRRAVVRHLVDRSGIEPVLTGLPAGVEASARGDVVTVINHTPHPVDGPVPLGPYGYRIIRPRRITGRPH